MWVVITHPSYTKKVSPERLDWNMVIHLKLLHGADPGVRRRPAHHGGVNPEVTVVELPVELPALQQAAHALPHIAGEVPIVRVEAQALGDDIDRLLLAHVVDLVEDVLGLAIRGQGLEHLVGDLVAPVLLLSHMVRCLLGVGGRDALGCGLDLLSHVDKGVPRDSGRPIP